VVTKEVEKVYQVLNPAGTYQTVETHACAPRLDTVDGKIIFINQGEAYPVVLPVLIPKLQKDYPKTTFIIGYNKSYGTLNLSDIPKNAQAQIMGVSW
jgi:hypothetical protein